MSEESKKKLSRRKFIALTGGVIVTGGVLAACGDTATPATTTTASAATTTSVTTTTASAATTTSATTTTASAATTAASAGASSAPISKSGFKGTLQYWVLGYQPNGGNTTGKLMDAGVAVFTKANPDIKVEITGYSGDQAGFTKLTQAVQAGQTVDIFRLASDILPLLVKDNLVAPIDDYLTASDKADIYPNLLDSVKISGKAYAWPLWVPPVGMYLNLDVFKERNVTPPKSGWTYDDFVKIAQQLTFSRSNGDKVYGYSVVIDPDLVNSWPFIIGDGALPLNSDYTKYNWSTPDGISGLKKLVDLAQTYKVTPPDFGSQSIDDLATAFKDKKVVAMYSEPSGSSAGYKAAGLNFDVIDMPIGKSGKPLTAGGIGLISVAASSDKAKVEAAMDLGRYLTSSQVGHDVPNYYLAPGARKSVQVSDPINKFSPLVDHCYITPIIQQWPQIRNLIHPNIQNAVFGKISPEQAMNNPANEINGLLANGSQISVHKG